MQAAMTGGRRLALGGIAWLLVGCAGTGGNMESAEPGRLPPCPSSPNCVSSDANDAAHRIEPIAVGGDPRATWQALVELINTDPSYTVVERTDDRLRAEARTRWLRFVDDVEFQLRAEQGEIAMRSASRLGYSDLGANRRRLEAVRRALAQRSG